MKKIHTPVKLLVLLTIVMMLSSCYYDSEEDLYGNSINNCDTVNVSFSATVLPILNANCTSCHNSTNASGGVITESHESLIEHVQSGVFGRAINHTGPIDMPLDGQKLPACELAKINAWIYQGALKN